MSELKPSPKFNDALGYLETIDKLIKKFHESMFERHWDDAVILLCSLQAESWPRINDHKGSIDFDELKRKANSSISAKNQARIKIDLFNWFTNLNVCIHAAGLRMTDKTDIIDVMQNE